MIRKTLGGVLAALAVTLLVQGAAAQEKKTTTTPAPAAKTDAKAKPKPKSACNAMTDEAACKADATCSWVAASVDAKTGKQKRKAYCRTKPKPPAKKEPAKK